jgi:hypothetical protein
VSRTIQSVIRSTHDRERNETINRILIIVCMAEIRRRSAASMRESTGLQPFRNHFRTTDAASAGAPLANPASRT